MTAPAGPSASLVEVCIVGFTCPTAASIFDDTARQLSPIAAAMALADGGGDDEEDVNGLPISSTSVVDGARRGGDVVTTPAAAVAAGVENLFSTATLPADMRPETMRVALTSIGKRDGEVGDTTFGSVVVSFSALIKLLSCRCNLSCFCCFNEVNRDKL